jgi:hypothetical protein
VAAVAVVISPALAGAEVLQSLGPVPACSGAGQLHDEMALYVCNDVFSFVQKQTWLFPALRWRIDKKFLLSYFNCWFGLTE